MSVVAIVLLALVAVLSLVFIPLASSIGSMGAQDAPAAGIQVFMLSLARGVLWIAAMLLAVGAGRWDTLSGSRGLQSLLVVASVVLMEMVCCAMHLLSVDRELRMPFPAIYGVLGTLLPAVLLASGFVALNGGGAARALFFTGMGLSAAAGLGALLSYDPLTAEPREAREKEQAETAAVVERRYARLQQLPEDVRLAQLLAFANAADPWPVWNSVRERIRRIDGYESQLAAALRGPRRLIALYVLYDGMGAVPVEVREQCWTAAGEIATEFSRRLSNGEAPTADEFTILGEVEMRLEEYMGTQQASHALERTAVREVLLQAQERQLYHGPIPSQ